LQASVKSSVSRPHNPAGDNDGIKNCINCPAPSVCRLLQQNRPISGDGAATHLFCGADRGDSRHVSYCRFHARMSVTVVAR
jgi:hypothetical protein